MEAGPTSFFLLDSRNSAQVPPPGLDKEGDGTGHSGVDPQIAQTAAD
jgi:hypothetical protein